MIFSTNALSLLAAVALFGGTTFGMAVDVEGVVDDSKVTRGHSQRGLLTGRCPYAPKSEVPKAQPQDPHCTPDGMEELKGIYKKYCDLYGFKNNGDGNETVCIDPMNQHLTAEEIDAIENWTPKGMGPLEKLIGRWEGNFGLAYSAVPLYDPGDLSGGARRLNLSGMARVPQQPMTDLQSFIHEYKEVIVFTPIEGNVRNRGVDSADPINARCNMDQSIQGVTYNLQIIATGGGDTDGLHPKNGKAGDIIHEENGMYMYNTVPATGGGTGYEIIKLMSVPHGITITSLGNFSSAISSESSDALCEVINQQNGVNLDTEQEPTGTCAPDKLYVPGPTGDVSLPGRLNEYISNQTLKVSEVKEFVHINLAEHSHASIPFVEQQANTKNYRFDMWISDVVDENGKEQTLLQYGQRAFFEFMTRLECLDCEGVTSRDENGCIKSCAGLDDKIYEGKTVPGGDTVCGEELKKVIHPLEWDDIQCGKKFNDIEAFVHGQCFSCTTSRSPERGLAQGVQGHRHSCAEQPLILWPHVQVNTLRKVSDDTHSPADFKGYVCNKPVRDVSKEDTLFLADKLRNLRG